MLKKRLIGVITVKDNKAVQSISYKNYLPIGSPKLVAENLDRWGADEIICLSIDRSKRKYGPDFDLINSISSSSLSTPITYGGGIRDSKDASEVIKSGAERIIVDNTFQKNINSIRKISERIGSQALILSLPVCIKQKKYMLFNYINKKYFEINNYFQESLMNNYSSEIMLIDKNNEGIKDGFQKELLDNFPIKNKKLIIFGGLDNPEKIKYVLSKKEVNAIAIGNSLYYKEHSIQKIKEKLKLDCLRKSIFTEF